MAIVSSGQKDRVKRRERFCKKFGNLTAITAIFTVTLLLSTIPMNRRTHWDPLEYYLCTFASPRFLLFSSRSHSSVRILFRLPHFARPTSTKTELQKNYPSTLSALRNTRVLWRFARKFHREKKLSRRWLAQWSENPVEGVCGRCWFAKQEIFLSAVFSNKFFRLKQAL